MSSDYRPRGGGSGRRRRGGRGRGGPGREHSHGEHRSHSNGAHAAPKKKEGFISKLLGIFGKKKKEEPKHSPRGDNRPDRKEREPRAERGDRPERPRHEERERTPRPEPTPQEITSAKLYVGNLSYDAAESDLFDLFSKVGHVKNVEIAMDRRSNRSKGFGFVEMDELDSAKAAAEKLNRTDFMGRQIVVSGAKLDKRPAPASPREEAEPASPEEHSTESSGSPESTI